MSSKMFLSLVHSARVKLPGGFEAHGLAAVLLAVPLLLLVPYWSF